MSWSNSYYFILFVIFILVFNKLFTNDYMRYDHLSSHGFLSTTKITYYKDQIEVGFIQIMEVALFKSAVLYNFYVYPPYRRKGME